MCDELARRLGEPPEEILKEEVGKVLEKAIEDTPAMNVGMLRAKSDAARFTQQPATMYQPRYKVRRHLRKGNKVIYDLRRRYPNQLWAKITEARKADLKKRIAARGLAKQSWLKIADMLGISVRAPSYVEQALPSTGKTYEDERVQVDSGKGRLSYHIENSQPTVN